MKYFLSFLSLISLLVISCHYEQEEPVNNNGNNNGGNNNGNTNGGNNPTLKACNPDTVYFENDVLPILISNCAKSGCHDAVSKEDDVQITDYQSIISNIKPYNPFDSKLYKYMIKKEAKEIMPPPPAKPLTSTQLELIAKWILQGAKNNKCDASASGCNSNNATFSKTVKPIMDKYCIGCHSSSNPQGGIQLHDYQNIAKIAKSGNLYGAISHNPSYSKMPKGGSKLDQCDIDKIKNWIDNGAQNN